MAAPPITKVLAWGQYVHWAELQFGRYRATCETVSDVDRIGVVAHWLASEYVVLEGWLQLGLGDKTIEALLARYPEHCDVLKRCRNAVYHFQTEMLDERIAKCLMDENEELKWSVALHFEFQRYLLHFPYMHKGSWEERHELANEIRATLGWHPVDTPTSKRLEVYEKCMAFSTRIKGDTSQSAADAQAVIESTLRTLDQVDAEPFSRTLRRM